MPGHPSSADPIDGLLPLRHDAGLEADTGLCPQIGTELDIAGASVHPWGDVDCNGTIDPVDALKFLRYDAGLEVQRRHQSPNGTINTVDVGFYAGRLGILCSPTGP